MLIWGTIVSVGLWLIFRDMKPATRARFMGHPLLIHAIVIGSGLAIHGGSAAGAMAAIVSGVFSALYVRWIRKRYGYIKWGKFVPGTACTCDPRSAS